MKKKNNGSRARSKGHSRNAIAALASSMIDPLDEAGGDSAGSGTSKPRKTTEDSKIPAGYTYFGQMLAHDLTNDKTAGIPPNRDLHEQTQSPYLWLKPVYGISRRGPDEDPGKSNGHLKESYMEGPGRAFFRLGWTTPASANGLKLAATDDDLPRVEKEAQIPDLRSESNLALSQMHLMFMKLHNAVARTLLARGEGTGRLFDKAMREVILHYQWVILDDYLRRILKPTDFKKYVVGKDDRAWRKVHPKQLDAVPDEFALAIFRFGHSMARSSYHWTHSEPGQGETLEELFNQTGKRLSGGAIGANWPIDWQRMLEMGGNLTTNYARKIDTYLPEVLSQMPHRGGGSLAERTLLRGLDNKLPTGQEMATSYGLAKLSTGRLARGRKSLQKDHPELFERTPLWFYILAEAQHTCKGEHLGKLGGLHVAGVILDLMAESWLSGPVATGILRGNRDRLWRPSDSVLNIAPEADSIHPDRAQCTLAHLVRFAGLDQRPDFRARR